MAEKSKGKHVHVIAHTHWDRSWYWPLERFRPKLVECVKAVIRELKANPEYQFQFDGQVLMLEDYLAVCPEDREFLSKAARAGRIHIGPMYCLADVYCTGGEALIRNILIGKQWCDAFADGAGFSRVLHMPDTFGITPSMPMIADGFGMKAFTFMRGTAGQVPGLHDMADIQGIEPQLPEGTRFFKWKTPDGSEILTIRLRHGYASAAASRFFERDTGAINKDRYVQRLLEAAPEWDDPEHEVVLLMAGVDHMIPFDGQTSAMAEASGKGGYDYQFSNLEAVADHLASTDTSSLPECQNEFHGSGAASVLGGTLSARVYLKQTNAEIEQLLVHQVEPAVALGRLLGCVDVSENLIRHAWKSLLVTHPHDDICGCSVDAVHRKNESDMQQARESADAIRRRVFGRIMTHFGMNQRGDERLSFALINFQPQERCGPTSVQLDFEGMVEWGDVKLPDHYRLVDDSGTAVPFREVSRGQSVEHPRKVAHLEVFAPLPPLAPQRFYLEPVDEAEASASGPGAEYSAANEHFGVTLHPNGSFDLEDKSTGKCHHGLGLFSSQGDIGDSYDFSDIPEEKETIFDPISCRLQRREWPGGVVELIADGELELPAWTDSVTRTRSEQRVALPFRQTLMIAPGLRQVEVGIEFTNTAADHRLRWNLSLGRKVEVSLAGLKFNTIERPAGRRPDGDTPPRIFPEHPADHFVAAGDVALFSRFPFNYEIVTENKGQRLAATVFRSFSYLTNPVQGATRPGTHAGPHTLTPEGRCLGRRFAMRFAVRPLAESKERELLFAEAVRWRAQPLAGQIDATMPYPWRHDSEDDSSPAPVRIDGDVCISAFKPAEQGAGSILRLFNPHSKEVTATIHVVSPVRLSWVNLAEDSIADEEIIGSSVNVVMPPLSLRNLRIE